MLSQRVIPSDHSESSCALKNLPPLSRSLLYLGSIPPNPAFPAQPVRAGWSQSMGPQVGGRGEAGKGVQRIVGGVPPDCALGYGITQLSTPHFSHLLSFPFYQDHRSHQLEFLAKI